MGVSEHLPFKGESSNTFHTPGTDKNDVNQQGKQKEGLICSSHTKLRMWQVMVLNINTSEVRRTTYKKLSCLQRFIPHVVFHKYKVMDGGRNF